jgi:predicted homoserine dehydrogenase-like protein
MLLQREADDEPLRVGLIGAGKFGSMFLSQVQKTAGMHLLAVADLRPDQAREIL